MKGTMNKSGATVHSGKTHPRTSSHSIELKSDLITRLNRIEGQIRGIKSLIEKDTYCDDILTQISSVGAGMQGVGKVLLESHIKSCVAPRIEKGDRDILPEFLKTVSRLLK